MKSTDAQAFYTLMEKTWAAYGKPLEPMTVTVWSEDLMEYDLGVIEQALKAHRSDTERGRFVPTIADVMAKLQDHDNRPTGEQCWECSPLTEEAGVVWTEEWKQAYFSHVYPLVAEGKAIDRARSWFLQDYERRVKEARLRREPPTWESSGSLEAVHKAIQRQQAIGMVMDSRWLNHWLERNPVLPAPERKRLAHRDTDLVRVMAYVKH